MKIWEQDIKYYVCGTEHHHRYTSWKTALASSHYEQELTKLKKENIFFYFSMEASKCLGGLNNHINVKVSAYYINVWRIKV